MTDLGTLAPKIQTFFNQTANMVARASGFVERRSKLTGALFLQSLTFGFLAKPEASLTELAETSHDLGVSITKQGVQNRIEQAVPFLQAMFQYALALFQHELPLELKVLQQFSAIFLTDSSTVALPAALQDEFPGCGGCGPDAAVKIQLTFEFLRGVMAGVCLQAGRTPDQAYTAHLVTILPRALYLSDLGYFVLSHFRTIMEGAGYFLSRCDTRTALRTASGAPLERLAWLRTHPEPLFEQELLLGHQERLPCRMIVARVPPEVADTRRRKAQATARRKGRTLRARHLALMDWTLFVTNVPATQLTGAQVLRVYAVRWQVELIFKLWKSEGALARIAGRQRARVLSELYAKLIGIVMLQFLLAPYREGERELSMVKGVHIIQHSVSRLIEHLNHSERFTETLQDLAQRLLKNGMKDRRRKRLTTCQEIRAGQGALA